MLFTKKPEKQSEESSKSSQEIADLRALIEKAKLSDALALVAIKELERMENMDPSAPEYSIGLNYIEYLLSLPWRHFTNDNLDLKRAEKIMESRHYGLNSIKERMLEYLSVRTLFSLQAFNILVVDDEEIARDNLEYILRKEGYEISTAANGLEALNLLKARNIDLILTDLKMEKMDGIQLLESVKQVAPFTEIIMITGFATLESAVEAMKHGAFHYVAKPFKLDEVRRVVHEATEKVRLKNENTQLREQIDTFQGRVKIITQNQAMRDLLGTARQVAPTDCNVLISGESGTGKELFAKFIHHHSARASGPFMAINCGAFQEDLLANELFGHEKGAFTGAQTMKRGLIEMASGGTLFLDEVTEMSTTMQVKLLRVIQERELIRVGGTQALPVDVRFVAAANRDFQESIKNGSFRQDLYFRLNVIGLHIPPLSERKEDIALLAYYFVKKYALLMKKEVVEIANDVLVLLANYDFPGNVRELENIIERGVALSTGKVIEVAQLPDDLRELNIRTFRKRDGKISTLDEQEGEYIKWVLEETGWNRTLAAQILGIDRVSLWRKLKKMGLDGE